MSTPESHLPERSSTSTNPPGHTSTSELIRRLGLPYEVSAQQAAEVLGVDKKTLLQYFREGLLPARNIAPPTSTRPVYRFPLDKIVDFRNSYSYCEPAPEASPAAPSSTKPTRYEARHIEL
jgi:hypothetical protein